MNPRHAIHLWGVLLASVTVPFAGAAELAPAESAHFAEVLGNVQNHELFQPEVRQSCAAVPETRISRPMATCGAGDAIDYESLREKSRLLWLNTRLEIESKSEPELRQTLRLQSEELERFAQAARKANAEATAQELSFSADRVKALSDDPKLKEKLLDTVDLAASPSQKTWNWREAGFAEYSGTLALTAGAVYFEKANAKSGEAQWKGRNGFDETMRNALRLNSRSARDFTSTVSDVLMGGLIAAPFVDSTIAIGIRDRDGKRLWQTSVINVESFAFTSLASSLLQNVIQRERPFVRNCPDGNCEYGLENRSMPSGHAAFAFTGAGLICTHRSFQSLYGKNADQSACIAALGLATATGIARIMADRHYTTDVAAGTLIGLFSGVMLPRLLHYSWESKTTKSSVGLDKNTPSKKRELAVTPLIMNGGGGISCELKY